MPISPDGEINYAVDDFAWPWETPESILCVQGVAEGTRAWVRWVPYLARLGRVVRMDQRGYGDSTPMAADFAWNLDQLADDVVRGIVIKEPDVYRLPVYPVSGPLIE